MATLEKIRSKSVMLIVVIGVALLAFIVGDALTNSRNLFGDNTTVAKIGGKKIDYTEYQRKREELNRQLEQLKLTNPQQYANFDVQMLGQMAVEQLVGERLLDDAVKNAGIESSPEQLRFFVLDNPINREAMSNIIQQLNASGFSAQTPAQAYEIIFNPGRNGMSEQQAKPFQNAWVAMEEETKQLIKRQKYQQLVIGTVKANDLDKKALYNDYVATNNVSLAFRPYGAIDEKKYPVSDSEVNAAYTDEKAMFEVLEPTKEVSFIAINIASSEADRAAAKALAQNTLKALNDSAANGLPANIKKEGVVMTRSNVRTSDLRNGPVKNFVSEAKAGEVSMVTENLRGFEIVKMGKRSYEVDSIQVNIVQVAGADLPAKVTASLNAGLPIDSINKQFSADSVFAQKEQWIPLFAQDGPTGALAASQLDSLRQAAGKYVAIMNSPQGAVLAKIVKQNAPVEVVEFEEYNYQLNPSAKTVDDEIAKFEKYLEKNNTAELFSKNAAEAGYNVQTFQFTQSTPAVPRMAGYNQFFPDSRQVVRWAMIEGKPGQVSHIYESKDASAPMLYAVAVDAQYDDYVPTTNADVKNYLTNKVRRQKAGKDLVAEYQKNGKTLDAVSKAMGVEPRQLESFRMGRGMGVNDPKVLGQIAGAKADKKLVVIPGDDGVYAFVVNGSAKSDMPYNESNYEQQYFQLVNPNLDQMLRGSDKLVNKSYKFEAGE
ncbi:MAG: SurA N-terminal domain-containing protein [Muribaculaceae bacterium]|nr:SurA N-terminal domain-containing protein [Muribaculaceae bacterium]